MPRKDGKRKTRVLVRASHVEELEKRTGSDNEKKRELDKKK